jgi:hypothetical protein
MSVPSEGSDRHFTWKGRKGTALLFGSQTLLARPSGKGRIRMKPMW